MLCSAIGVVAIAGGVGFEVRKFIPHSPISTGKFLSPLGDQTDVGSFPVNMVLSPDGKYICVTDIGFRQQLSILNSKTGALVDKVPFNDSDGQKKDGLYYGVAIGTAGARTVVYASQGSNDLISVLDLGADGKLTKAANLNDGGRAGMPNNPAGIAVSADGGTVYAVNNESYAQNAFAGSVSIIDPDSNSVQDVIQTPAFPLAVVAVTRGPRAGKRLYVSCERDGVVAAVDLATKRFVSIPTGASPAYLLLDPLQRFLYVSNAGSDTLSIIDTATDTVVSTILLRESNVRGLPGATPLGMALSRDGGKLFVAMGDINAIAVVDLRNSTLQGFLPAGWYPTSLVVSPDGSKLFVANAKGVQERNPNGKDVRGWGQYIEDILEGTVTTMDLRRSLSDLKHQTAQVLANNLGVGSLKLTDRDFHKPPIKHVIYVIKENRTYDQVLGDDPRGNGDRSLVLFGKDVTPNQHALADRFALIDNFYVCAEVSADGWNWSTSGMASAYTQRNVPYNYSGRGRDYDFEGSTNNEPVKLEGLKDVAEAPGGYIWGAALRAGKSIRNYGFFVAFGDVSKGAGSKLVIKENEPDEPELVGRTNVDFRRFDTAFPDSEARIKLGLAKSPKQVGEFGKYKDPSRISAWLRDFHNDERTGKLPDLSLLRLMCDHTAGTSPGFPSPRSMNADNDYAVGQLVDAVSHSRFWKDTAICVLEDDAQDGFDHVDAHRSPAWIISPYVRAGTVIHSFVNTDSMLRTMELLLGLKPMSQFDAIAAPINAFGSAPANIAPYGAILPSKEILGEENHRTAYRAKDSARLIARFDEASAPDMQLNDILWGAIKGPNAARPSTPGAIWTLKGK